MTTLDAMVTIRLPRALYERAAQAARQKQQAPDEFLCELVEVGLDKSVRELLGEAAVSYQARLANEGRLHQTHEEILAELSTARVEVARELRARERHS